MKKGIVLLYLISSLAHCSLVARNAVAQQAEENGVPVQMVVTVEGRHGAEAPEVGAKDVLVSEGRTRDKVLDWIPARGDHAALQVFILIDDSSNQNVALQFDDVRNFINAQPSSALIGIAYMQNGIARVAQDLTGDRALAGKALRLPLGIRTINGNPYFAVSDLVKRWPKTNARRQILMVSSGIDPNYTSADLLDPYLSSAIDAAQRAGIQVSAIYTPSFGHYGHSYWRTYWGQMYLAEIAERTGGEAYYIGMTGPPVSFAPYLKDFAERLNNQYLLTFAARPGKKAGLRSVKVRTELPDVELVAADSVWVPAP